MKDAIHFIRHFIHRFFILRTLFSGSPSGENGILGIRKDLKNTHALIDELTKAMERFGRENKIPFIKTASENPVLWTGMKGASAASRKKVNQILKQA